MILSGISRKKSYVRIFKYGTGKTFLTTLILAKLRKECRIALAVASSRITFTLLPGVRTAYAAFKLLLDLYLNENSVCYIRKTFWLAEVIRQCHLVVFDEYTMMHKRALEAID